MTVKDDRFLFCQRPLHRMTGHGISENEVFDILYPVIQTVESKTEVFSFSSVSSGVVFARSWQDIVHDRLGHNSPKFFFAFPQPLIKSLLFDSFGFCQPSHRKGIPETMSHQISDYPLIMVVNILILPFRLE